MKGWQVALLCVAVAALAVTGTLLFTRQTEEEVPQVDIPRYTADQVIAVAKAYAGEARFAFLTVLDEKWATVYLGNGEWKVTRECSYQGQYPWSRTTVASDWTFYEATGELKPR